MDKMDIINRNKKNFLSGIRARHNIDVLIKEEFKFIFEFLRTWIDMKMFSGNLDDGYKVEMIDPEFPFKRKPYGKLYPDFNNSSSRYSLSKGFSYEYDNNKYETQT